jgi:hypothetical protein
MRSGTKAVMRLCHLACDSRGRRHGTFRRALCWPRRSRLCGDGARSGFWRRLCAVSAQLGDSIKDMIGVRQPYFAADNGSFPHRSLAGLRHNRCAAPPNIYDEQRRHRITGTDAVAVFDRYVVRTWACRGRQYAPNSVFEVWAEGGSYGGRTQNPRISCAILVSRLSVRD